ncbi:hypothetical protein HHK36_027548 [Tetracentron sinense]|uniref:Trehalose 6-phosphate phosphatase n=1 Tax=Tetracentron sinense TaxID=13715 RepID=A0A834YD96_TETSI|nr:hypothetical protein HHK36_027548 [Tetracentron sinense]
MGLRQLLPYQQNMESISKAGLDVILRTPKTCDLPQIKECDRGTIEPNILDVNYSSWVVSFTSLKNFTQKHIDFCHCDIAQMKHPSALSKFDRMMTAAKGRKIVVFLDYDGTLSPIVDDPDRAFMSDAMRSAVSEVARYFPTAIISGRCRDKVYEFVQLTDVYYAGSHGMDIMAPLRHLKNNDGKYQTRAVDKKGNEVVLFQPAQDFLPAIQEILKVLEEKTKRIQGVVIENNRFCISVHFRRVCKEVMEIRPSIKWDKGYALEYLLDTLGFGSSGDVLPLYIGDDRTDEDAFKVIESRGEGYSIIVSSIPKDTRASYSLRDPSEVKSFLLRLARWKTKLFY